MEVQLEEEYEDKQKVLREKRDLESRLNSVSEQVWWRRCNRADSAGFTIK